MQKFLSPLFAGLFVISLLLAPVAVLADTTTPVEPAMTCTLRSEVDAIELESLTSVTGLTKLDAGDELPDSALYDSNINANFGIICAYSLIEWITNIAFLIIAALSVLMIIFAAFLYITAGANPEGTKKAKNFLLYAVIGIVVAILARLIPNIIINFLR